MKTIFLNKKVSNHLASIRDFSSERNLGRKEVLATPIVPSNQIVSQFYPVPAKSRFVHTIWYAAATVKVNALTMIVLWNCNSVGKGLTISTIVSEYLFTLQLKYL